MSDSESGDEMDELQAIIDEYAAKDKESTIEHPSEEKPKESEPPTQWERSEEEIRLDKLIFGDKEGLLENLKKSSTKPDVDPEQPREAKKRKPAWEDEDDNIKIGEVQKRTKTSNKPLKDELKQRYKRVMKTPKWAELDRKPDVDSDDEILQTVGFISKTKSEALKSHDISLKKLRDVNRATYAEGSISSIQFHPTSTVAMVSGDKGIATLYSIDGTKNDKLHSIRFESFPILCAKILDCGTKAMFTSQGRHYYTYDLMQATETRHQFHSKLLKIKTFEVSPNGKYFAAPGIYGEVHLFDMKSKEFIHTFKQEEHCKAVKFSLDCTKMICSSSRSTVSIFDIRQQRVMHSFLDDGCIRGKTLALSPNGQMLATGSAEGAVNIYSYEKVFASKAPQPEKTILNLTTAISSLNFNHTSEILGICSKTVKAGVRLVHFPSGTVFANFPGYRMDSLNRIQSVEFSPASGYMALGTTGKAALLYRLKHFNNY